MKRYGILSASVVIQLVLGSIYAWSTIAQELTGVHGFAAWQTQLIYGLTIFVFSASLILGGKLFRRKGPRFTATLGGVLFGTSYLLAAVLPLHPMGLILLLGLLSGISIGLGYANPLSTGVAWFPNHKGLVTGVAVFGFGGGAILANQLYTQILAAGGGVQQIFLLVGTIGGGLVILAAQVLDLPDHMLLRRRAEKNRPRRKTEYRFFRSPGFWRLAAGLGLGSAPGLLLIGRAAGIAVDLGFDQGGNLAIPALGVAAVSLGNAGGRLFWGWLNDRIPRYTIVLSLVLSSVSAFSLLFGDFNALFFLAMMFLTGFTFGGSLVIYAAHTEAQFGEGSLAVVYPFIFMFYGAAAVVGPSIGGALYDITGSSTGPIILAAVLPCVGLLLTTILSKLEAGRQEKTGAEEGLHISDSAATA